MSRKLFAVAALTTLLPLGACASMGTADRAPLGDFGEATLVNAEGARVGRAVLTQGPTGLLIRVEATGMTPGWHGIHLHQVGQCEGAFTSAGGHIHGGEGGKPHGLLNPAGPDDGDLPNVHADATGRVMAEVFTPRARISATGPGALLWDDDGAAIVIHAGADDHTTQPIGGAGARVACGILAAG
jgi:superoxide dismutase, Cu-Zn family